MARKSNSFKKDTFDKDKKFSRSRRKDSTRKEKSFDSDSALSKPNDVAWYAQNGQLLNDVASFSYNYPVGSKMPKDIYGTKFINNTSVPGIMTIHTTPRYGVLQYANDPVNIAMRNIYSFVRYANSGKTNYEGPDQMLYLLAMDSCHSFIALLKRVYGVIMTYSDVNRYFPKAAVHAQGFNFNDLQRNIADFRAYINTLAVKVGSMCIPASMSYMARHMWMYSGLYYDTPEDSKAQVYMYVPEAFYRYTLDSDGAGSLQLVDFDRTKYCSDFVDPDSDETNGWTYHDIVEFGNALIDPILASQDMNIMSGDILKAYGAGNVYMVSAIPETYTVLPTYSEEVLNQIHNTTLCGRSIQPSYAANSLPTVTADNAIVQSPDKTYLMNTPHGSQVLFFSNDHPHFWEASEPDRAKLAAFVIATQGNKKILDFQSGPVTPGSAMVASRLTATLSTEDDDIQVIRRTILDDSSVAGKYHGVNPGTQIVWVHDTFESCGSETAGFAKIWYYAHVGYNSENNWCLIHSEDIYSGTLSPAPHVWNPEADPQRTQYTIDIACYAAQRKAMLSVFNMHPAIQDAVIYRNSDGFMEVLPPVWPQFDINYYTVLDVADLTQMHEAALLSELNVTQYGRKAE